MFRLAMVALAALGCAQLPRTAQATTISFELINSISGPESGSGVLDLNGPIGPGLDVFSSGGGGLNSLSIDIGGQEFTLSNALGPAQAIFQNGAFSGLFYVGQMGNFKLSLDTTGLFYLYTDLSDWTLTSAGTIAATPIPSTILLFAGGLLALGLVTYRRKRQADFSSSFLSLAVSG